MENKLKAISAISTPVGTGGIAIIRISGKDAFVAADKIFKSYNKKKVCDMAGYTCTYGEILTIEGEKIDTGVMTIFKSPHSYTGENIVEISCHGGIFVSREVLRATLDAGCRLAEPGEFTKIAFLNGKLSLDKAENVMDIISADSKAELKIANEIQSGKSFKSIEKIKNQLVDILGKLAAWADFPEEDVPEVTDTELKSDFENILCEMNAIYKTYDYGQRLKNGIPTVILGKPNVGKSTLFNLLVGQNKSIVTDIEGTTRDVIEEIVHIGDITLRLFDTAGLRKTDNKIENIGIEIAVQKLDMANLVLLLFDSTKPINLEDIPYIDKIKDKTTIAVVNKSDLNPNFDIEPLKKLTKNIVVISAKENRGMDDFEELLKNLFFNNEITTDNGWIANDRQRNCLKKAIDCINEAQNQLDIGMTFDIITVILDDALDNLLELTGEKVSEEVVNNVFKKFCVGK